MTIDELAANLGISFLFERKNRVIKVYSPPSKAYQSIISFRVPEEHTGVLDSEEMHQWEDTFEKTNKYAVNFFHVCISM